MTRNGLSANPRSRFLHASAQGVSLPPPWPNAPPATPAPSYRRLSRYDRADLVAPGPLRFVARQSSSLSLWPAQRLSATALLPSRSKHRATTDEKDQISPVYS